MTPHPDPIEALRKQAETVLAIPFAVDWEEDDAKTVLALIAKLRRCEDALRGVIRVADRNTVEFDAARAALRGES